MGRIQHWSTWCQVRVGSCGYVLSYQAPKAAAFRGPGVSNAYPLLKAPGRACPEAQVLPQVEEGVETSIQVAKSYLLAPILGLKSEGMDYFRD
jgi:hypothetical protein